MLCIDKQLIRHFVLNPRFKPQLSTAYWHTIVTPALYKIDARQVFEYNYECMNRYATVRMTL